MNLNQQLCKSLGIKLTFITHKIAIFNQNSCPSFLETMKSPTVNTNETSNTKLERKRTHCYELTEASVNDRTKRNAILIHSRPMFLISFHVHWCIVSQTGLKSKERKTERKSESTARVVKSASAMNWPKLRCKITFTGACTLTADKKQPLEIASVHDRPSCST